MLKISKVNGFTTVSYCMPNVETVSVGAWVKVGSRHEQENISGISHFLEHMLFKGTTKRSAFDISKEIENVGGIMNAYTTRESTAYYAKVIKKDLELAIDIIADMLINSTFDSTELEKERQVILQEIAQVNDNPSDIIFDHFQKYAFQNSISRPVLGVASSVKSISSDDLRTHLNKYFESRDNIIFAAAGNINHCHFEDLIAKYVNVRNPNSKDSRNLESAKYVGGKFEDFKNLEQSNIVLGFEGIPYNNAKYYDMLALSNITGGCMSSKLFQKIREELGLAYSIYSFTSFYNDCGTFGIYSGTSHESVAKLIDSVTEELHSIKISTEELQRAKSQLCAAVLMELENTSIVADNIASETINLGNPRTKEDILYGIDMVSKDNVMSLAERIFSSNCTKIILS